jgi:tripartite-type tricarboxylate transporter receptor subunit TctC
MSIKMPILRIFVAFFIASFSVTALAQQYPTRPIRLVASSAPGGTPDLLGRALAEKLTVALGQPVVVENRTGAAGNIGADVVAKAAPDGYTLLIGINGIIVINPHLYQTMTFDTLKDLAPLATVASVEMVLAVNQSVPVKTFPEFIEYAKKSKPPLAYASIGNGSLHHLAMEMIKLRAGIDLLHVPFRGAPQAAMSTAAGDTQVLFAGGGAKPLMDSGKLLPLAGASGKRSSASPDLPTISEFYPGLEATSWVGMFAPAGTPEPILAILRKEVNKLLATPDMRTKFSRAGGLEPFITTPAEMMALIKSDYATYGKLIKQLGVKND